GATISFLVSYFLQKKSFAEARRIRETERNEKRQAIGYSLLFKMSRIHSDLESLAHAVRSALENARNDGRELDPFLVVTPVVPLPDPIKFSAEEMALLISLDSDLFNEMNAMDELHKTAVTLFETYKTERAETFARLDAKMDGAPPSTLITPEQLDWLSPWTSSLNSLINAMLYVTERDGQNAWPLLERLNKLLYEKLDVRHKLGRKQKSEVKSLHF